jgi:hypothetical protein
MNTPIAVAASPVRRQAVDTFRRARKLPPGSHRNDLRQLAFGLLRLHRVGVAAVAKAQAAPASDINHAG